MVKDGLQTKRDRDSEKPMIQSCSKLGNRRHSNCSIGWPLVSGMEQPTETVVNELQLHKAVSVQRWLDLKWIQI